MKRTMDGTVLEEGVPLSLPSSLIQIKGSDNAFRDGSVSVLDNLTIPESMVNENNICEVVWSYGSSPESFWVQRYARISYQNLVHVLQLKLKQKELRQLTRIPKIGQFVVGLDEGVPFRGKVLDLHCNYSNSLFDTELDLLNIDVGCCVQVPAYSTYHVDLEVAAIPAQAFHCSLPYVCTPSEDGSNSYNWQFSAEQMFIDLVSDSILIVDILCKSPNHPYTTHLVDVFCCSREWDSSVNLKKVLCSKFTQDILNGHQEERRPLEFGNSSVTKSVVETLLLSGKEVGSKRTQKLKEDSIFPDFNSEKIQLLSYQEKLKMKPMLFPQDIFRFTKDITASPNIPYKSVIKAPLLLLECDSVIGTITHVVSPGQFYIRNMKTDSEFRKLQKRMNKMYESDYRPEFVLETELRIGCPVAVKDEKDGTWHRCTILDIKVKNQIGILHSQRLKFVKYFDVFFVDIGYKSIVKANMAYPLMYYFTFLSSQAIRCSLAGCFPMEGKEAKWSVSSVNKFRELKTQVESFHVYAVDHDFAVGSTSVLIDDVEPNTYNLTINEAFVVLEGADSELFDLYDILQGNEPTEIVETDDRDEDMQTLSTLWSPKDEDFESYQNRVLDLNDPCAAVSGYDFRGEKNVCRDFRRFGRCRKHYCKFEHVRLDSEGYTTDKQEVYNSTFRPLYLPPNETTCHVRVTSIISPWKFYAIFPDDREFDFDGEPPETETSVTNHINNYAARNELKPILLCPACGEFVIARCHEDGRFYRAKVLESCPDTQMVMVFFVDYGRKQGCKFSELRQIEPEFMYLAEQAVECFLANFEPDLHASPEASMKANDYAKSVLSKKNVTVTIVSRECVNATAYVRVHDGMADYAKNLVLMKFGKWNMTSASQRKPRMPREWWSGLEPRHVPG